MNIPEGWPTDEMITAGNWEMINSPALSVRKIFISMLAVAPTPPAQEVEPVAYMEKASGQLWPAFEADQMLSDDVKRTKLTPLYTRPDNDGLRKAAEAFVKAYKPGWDHHGMAEYNDLCTELDKGKPRG